MKLSEEAKLWWKQSQDDLDTAFQNLKIKKYYVCVFFAQQAVEKALKAIILEETKKLPPKIHQLLALGHVVLSEKEIIEILDSIKMVDPGYILSRYPETSLGKTPAEMVDQTRAEDIFDNAERITKWLKNKFQIQL
ncbi:HEPN domain-containing protein [Candidatus Gottesmanbacteria bacterium]|nr:HEPN domain-containing protein [Candidatus Gottesmanbacteria bacterium]